MIELLYVAKMVVEFGVREVRVYNTIYFLCWTESVKNNRENKNWETKRMEERVHDHS